MLISAFVLFAGIMEIDARPFYWERELPNSNEEYLGRLGPFIDGTDRFKPQWLSTELEPQQNYIPVYEYGFQKRGKQHYYPSEQYGWVNAEYFPYTQPASHLYPRPVEPFYLSQFEDKPPAQFDYKDRLQKPAHSYYVHEEPPQFDETLSAWYVDDSFTDSEVESNVPKLKFRRMSEHPVDINAKQNLNTASVAEISVTEAAIAKVTLPQAQQTAIWPLQVEQEKDIPEKEISEKESVIQEREESTLQERKENELQKSREVEITTTAVQEILKSASSHATSQPENGNSELVAVTVETQPQETSEVTTELPLPTTEQMVDEDDDPARNKIKRANYHTYMDYRGLPPGLNAIGQPVPNEVAYDPSEQEFRSYFKPGQGPGIFARNIEQENVGKTPLIPQPAFAFYPQNRYPYPPIMNSPQSIVYPRDARYLGWNSQPPYEVYGNWNHMIPAQHRLTVRYPPPRAFVPYDTGYVDPHLYINPAYNPMENQRPGYSLRQQISGSELLAIMASLRSNAAQQPVYLGTANAMQQIVSPSRNGFQPAKHQHEEVGITDLRAKSNSYTTAIPENVSQPSVIPEINQGEQRWLSFANNLLDVKL